MKLELKLLVNREQMMEFYNILSDFNLDFDIYSSHTWIDGKDLESLFTLDMSKPFMLYCYGDEYLLERVQNLVSDYIYIKSEC